MAPALKIIQQPEPGQKLLRFRGDVLVISLRLDRPVAGTAGLRSNMGRAAITRREIVGTIDENLPKLGQDWFDLPMIPVDAQGFQLRLPLVDAGHFEAKAFFVPEGKKKPLWAPGPNLTINVEPADTCCDNSIYNAFVRQFGPNKAGGFFDATLLERTRSLDQAGYVVIPPSGTFRDVIAELDFIIGTLGCRWIQLLPIYPTPTTYGRMGRFGSPYAALSFTAIDPALARFDQKHTPLEQFVELVDAIHSRNAKLLLDIAVNHTGWAASLHESHPNWLVRGAEGEIEVPGAWGVRWEDLTKLNFKHQDLWQYMADVFLTWCRRGVDGFRCDAGYMIPQQVWRYIIAKVRGQYPDTIFFLEGLGGKISVTRDLLDTANFNWAYSELFQNYDRAQIESYLPEALDISSGQGIMVNYAETHDNLRLAARSQTWAKMRTALCALSSPQGAFGFANGVEWYATEKINVHEAPSLNWGAPVNQVAEIHRLNTILKTHPAFHDQTCIRLIQTNAANVVTLERVHEPSAKRIVVLANLDDQHPNTARWPQTATDPAAAGWLDLLSDSTVTPRLEAGFMHLDLAPGQVCCLTADPLDGALLTERAEQNCCLPQRVILQQLKAKALEVWQCFYGFGDIGEWDLDQAAALLQEDPCAFCRQWNPISREARVVSWQWPRDVRREIMLPPDFFLLIKSPHAFRAQVGHNQRVLSCENSLPAPDGGYWALLTNLAAPEENQRVTLQITVHLGQESVHAESALLLLGRKRPRLAAGYAREDLSQELRVLGTNGRGAMLLLPVEWGARYSRYDAALAANLHPEIPVDRWIMFVNCQMWVVFRDYSQAVNGDCLERFTIDGELQGTWTFRIPTGHGTYMRLHLQPTLQPRRNVVQILMEREAAHNDLGRLPDHEEVELILRPGIENRSYHQITKAYLGPEFSWPSAVHCDRDGFSFRPDGEHTLVATLAQAAFVPEPEWYYMRYHAEEDRRGFDPHSDLFSPGYFKIGLRGGRQACLNATVSSLSHDAAAAGTPDPRPGRRIFLSDSTPVDLDWLAVLKAALRQFIVERSGKKTVIAGYPWFLDWGRDAIIVTRGLIASGECKPALDILKLFGQFEQAGTLPNMIEGTHTGNRDTSDAPLWFIVACGDLAEREDRVAVLQEKCGSRALKQVMQSIARSYMEGTANGIKMDSDTGLIFSPSHFTWMDTNHPAGTPREGYPIEIQALWYAALCVLHKLDPKNKSWGQLAKTVKQAINRYFAIPSAGYLSDCLHTSSSGSVGQAEADDALRPNQLFAITMGAVDDPDRCRLILEASQELLVPGAMRSLADKPLARPLEITYQGRLLSDPHHPYRGRYEGDEDTQRKPAYHNGTAWTWLFPTFCESWAAVYGPGAHATARAWLGSAAQLMAQGCIGQIPEILDGDFPHRQRGCPAQAWGVSEILRVASKIDPV
jgi:predicted glycogen debranching enzyme